MKISQKITRLLTLLCIITSLCLILAARKKPEIVFLTKNSVTGTGKSSLVIRSELFGSDRDELISLVSTLCNPEKMRVQITQGRFINSDKLQFFVACDMPATLPLPSLYLLEQRPQSWGGTTVLWSKVLDNRVGHIPGSYSLTDINKDGFSEVSWNYIDGGGTCAPFSSMALLYDALHGEEFSIKQNYEMNKTCELAHPVGTEYLPDPKYRDWSMTHEFYEYLKNVGDMSGIRTTGG